MKRLVLIGGGHAHLEVLRSLIRRPLPGVESLLISLSARQHYSSMVPGYLQGAYRELEFRFDLAALCRRAGARFIMARAERVSGTEQIIETASDRIPFDFASLDVGSDPSGLDIPGVAEHAFTVRPMSHAFELEGALSRITAQTSDRPIAVRVVGGGAAGIEVALAIHRTVVAALRVPHVTVLERDSAILKEFDARARARVHSILTRRGIRVRTGMAVAGITAGGLTLESGETLPSDLTVWLTGASPPAIIARSDMPIDDHGFFLVDSSLRSVDGVPVWGAGDCVTLRDFPRTPKAGVYAVREAPVLANNLRAALAGASPRRYTPQPDYLVLLNTADGRALLRWRFIVNHSRWAWHLKDRIDKTFVRRYQGLIDAW